MAKSAIGDVIIDKNGVKNAFGHGTYADKFATLSAVKPVIEQGAYLGTARDSNSKPISNYYFAGTVSLDGAEKIVLVRARQSRGGEIRYYDHHVFDAKGSRLHTEPRKDIGNTRQSASYERMIRDFPEVVKNGREDWDARLQEYFPMKSTGMQVRGNALGGNEKSSLSPRYDETRAKLSKAAFENAGFNNLSETALSFESMTKIAGKAVTLATWMIHKGRDTLPKWVVDERLGKMTAAEREITLNRTMLLYEVIRDGGETATIDIEDVRKAYKRIAQQQVAARAAEMSEHDNILRGRERLKWQRPTTRNVANLGREETERVRKELQGLFEITAHKKICVPAEILKLLFPQSCYEK